LSLGCMPITLMRLKSPISEQLVVHGSTGCNLSQLQAAWVDFFVFLGSLHLMNAIDPRSAQRGASRATSPFL